MANYLAIDTSAGTSVALSTNGQLVARFDNENSMQHAEVIGLAIAGVLEEARLQPDAVIVARGPAPFTGLRVGLAAAALFAASRDLPLFGVMSLDAVAHRWLTSKANRLKPDQPLLVTSDARRREVYYALYSGVSQKGSRCAAKAPG